MKEYLICIDSDGCAIDSMEIKHRRCFGPCMIPVWHLEAWEEPILSRWNDINLYTMTRGINRFLGLNKMLSEIDRDYTKIPGLAEYSQWCRETKSYSNAAVQSRISAGAHPIFGQVLDWSNAVNERIAQIAPEVEPFEGVEEALKQAGKKADIAIVSSANPQAVGEEWTRFGFLEHVTYIMAQDAGTKSDCIGRLAEKGYAPSRILMVGDAPGDWNAAEENGVLYFPILAGRERESWQRFLKEGFDRFLAGTFDDAYQTALLELFFNNLSDKS